MFRNKLAIFGFCLVFSIGAQAGTITHTSDRAIFEGQFSSVIVEDFGPDTHFPITSGILNDDTTEAGIAAGDIAAGVTFSTEVGSGNFFNIDCCFSNGTPFLDSVTGSNELTVTFDAPQQGFGFDTDATFMGAFDITIFFAGGGSFFGNFAPGTGFAGFTSSSADISSVLIDATAGAFPFALDNFTFTDQSVAPVPAPAGIALFGLGLAGLISVRRKKAVSVNG